MAGPDDRQDEERKSRSVVFLIASAALLVSGLWAVWNDNISRRPWKYYQREFREVEFERADQALAEEAARLAEDPAYQKAQEQLAAARASLENGDAGRAIATHKAEIGALAEELADRDLAVRFVKSELEEAWYEYDHARHLGHSGEAERAYLDELEARRIEAQAALDEIEDRKAALEEKIETLRADVTQVADTVDEIAAERTRLEQRRDGLLTHVMGPVKILKVPVIQQTVLEEFDRNAYNQPVARVDRCVSCHVGINSKGFHDLPHPYKTHPDRKLLLGKHPPEKFGCTPCHDGQGAGVNSVAQAHGNVIFWEHPLLEGEEIQARCDGCHASVEGRPHMARLAQGRRLFEQLGCHGCHLVEGYGHLEKVGPYLRRVAAKVDPSWLIRWTTNPHAFRPDTRMPNFMFAEEQGVAVAAYLLAASAEESAEWLAAHPEPPGVDPADQARVARGRALSEEVGCRGCHAFEPAEHARLLGANKDMAPNLSRIAEKTDARWLYHWLRNPRHFSPVSKMPSLRLSDDEAGALASYLLTLGAREPAPPARLSGLSEPEMIAEGERLVRKYGCAGCHDIPGMEGESRIGVELSTFEEKSLEELFFGDRLDIPQTWKDWTFHKIKTPRTYETERIEQLMPQFALEDDDIDSLIVFLAGRNGHTVPAQYRYKPDDPAQGELVEGQRLVEKYNCRGCHVIDEEGGFIARYYEETPSFAPPVLNGEGAKVQPDWLFGFLKAPTTIRPWLKVRMPTFNLSDEETAGLVRYFAALDGRTSPFVYVDTGAIPPSHIEAARLMLSRDYFDCYSCHVQGDKKPEGPPEGWAPDLTMAKHRLNPDWIVRWLEDPQKVQPGTKMPSFYPGGPDDILGGDDDRQIRAIRDYLMVLGTPQADDGELQVASQVASDEEPSETVATQ